MFNHRMEVPLEYVRCVSGRNSAGVTPSTGSDKQPLCMDQYRTALITYRRPGVGVDQQIRHFVTLDPGEPCHVTVAHKGLVGLVNTTILNCSSIDIEMHSLYACILQDSFNESQKNALSCKILKDSCRYFAWKEILVGLFE